jgi:hypothetical protein
MKRIFYICINICINIYSNVFISIYIYIYRCIYTYPLLIDEMVPPLYIHMNTYTPTHWNTYMYTKNAYIMKINMKKKITVKKGKKSNNFLNRKKYRKFNVNIQMNRCIYKSLSLYLRIYQNMNEKTTKYFILGIFNLSLSSRRHCLKLFLITLFISFHVNLHIYTIIYIHNNIYIERHIIYTKYI